MDPRIEEKIRQRAYEIWEREGRPAGRAEEHWRQACLEIGLEGHSGNPEGAEAGDTHSPGAEGARTGPDPAQVPPSGAPGIAGARLDEAPPPLRRIKGG